jgi:hypothetical protein
MYKAVARLVAGGRAPQQHVASVSVQPVSLAAADVQGLPAELEAAPERGSLGRITLGPDGVGSSLAAVDPHKIWLLAWDGQRWLARSSDRWAEIDPGAWVAIIYATPDSRSAPVFVRWPPREVAVGAPLVLIP